MVQPGFLAVLGRHPSRLKNRDDEHVEARNSLGRHLLPELEQSEASSSLARGSRTEVPLEVPNHIEARCSGTEVGKADGYSWERILGKWSAMLALTLASEEVKREVELDLLD